MKKDRAMNVKLKRVASDLPKIKETVTISRPVLGKSIASVETDREGNKIKPTGKYIHAIDGERYVDHYPRLQKAFKKDGVDGVENYCRDVRRTASEQAEADRAAQKQQGQTAPETSMRKMDVI